MKFRKISPLLIAAALTAVPVVSRAAWVTFPDATGWTNDIVYGRNETGQQVTGTMDDGPNVQTGATFYQERVGVPPGTGLIQSMVYPSATGSGASFQFQSFNHSNNAVLLAPGTSGTLSLASPTLMSSLALYGCCGHGDITGSVVIHYLDGSSDTMNIGSIGHDWFFNPESVALTVHGRQNFDGSLDIHDDDPRIYEQLYTTKTSSPVVSVTINDISRNGAGFGGFLSVMAISGNTVPEPSTALLSAGGCLLAFSRRRRVQAALG